MKRIDLSPDDMNSFNGHDISELLDLVAITFSGDLVDSLTDFDGRVASWEHDAKETL